MKFKMSKDSIFAVLSRSPWWMSAGIALAFNVFAIVALPREFWAIGVFGSVPFVVIAGIAAYKQLRAPSSARVEAIAAAAAAMPWNTFADAMQTGFERDGCQVERLNKPGADFALTKAGNVAIVSAKRWKAARIGIEPLRELQAIRESRGAREAIYVTLGEVSATARQFAAAQSISLMTAAELTKLLRDLKV